MKGRAAMDFTVYAIHTDHPGTPIAMTDDSGTVVWAHRFSPFGESLELNEDPDNDGESISLNLRFPGQYYDSESGLHYNWHRYYDPITGRYLSTDEALKRPDLFAKKIIKYDSFLSTYFFANNNPVNLFDYNGKNPAILIGIGIGGGVAALGLYAFHSCVLVCTNGLDQGGFGNFNSLCDRSTLEQESWIMPDSQYCHERNRNFCKSYCNPFISLIPYATTTFPSPYSGIWGTAEGLITGWWSDLVGWFSGN